MNEKANITGMGTELRSKQRNTAIEYCRLIASVFVIFIHREFPGLFGDVMVCLGRFAVPFFFAVSGYFMYRVDEKVIKKRAISILKLHIYSTIFYLLWGSYKVKYIFGRGRLPWLVDLLSKKEISRWLTVGTNPIAHHLWYLNAIFVCYVIMYLYVRWQKSTYNYHSLYVVSVMLYAVRFLMDSMAPAVEFDISALLCRNALFFGIPMVGMGIFIREYQERIVETFQLSGKKLLLLVGLGMILSLIQSLLTKKTELSIGTLLEVFALMLLLVSTASDRRNNKRNSWIASKLGELSTYVYISHVFWIDIGNIYIVRYLSSLDEITINYLMPIWVTFVSVITGVIWVILKEAGRKLFQRLAS